LTGSENNGQEKLIVITSGHKDWLLENIRRAENIWEKSLNSFITVSSGRRGVGTGPRHHEICLTHWDRWCTPLQGSWISWLQIV